MRAFLVDDEPLALRRLERLLAATGRVQLAGSSSDPSAAVSAILDARPDVLFLDIEMPGMSGFDLLTRLNPQPWVVFTTAYSHYALQAFGVNSLDYLLKPVEAAQLNRALDKVQRLLASAASPPDIRSLLEKLAQPPWPRQIASRSGARIELIDLDQVTHFFASDKLTYAATPTRTYSIDSSISDLERRLDPARFIRVHRSTLVNLAHVQEIHTWFSGKLVVRLKDPKQTELTVSRDRVRALKERLGV